MERQIPHSLFSLTKPTGTGTYLAEAEYPALVFYIGGQVKCRDYNVQQSIECRDSGLWHRFSGEQADH